MCNQISLNLSIENHNVQNKKQDYESKDVTLGELRRILLKNHLLLSAGFLEWPLVLKHVLSFPLKRYFIPDTSVF